MSLDDRTVDRQLGNAQSIFSLGPILGGLALIVAISIGAWFYQQRTQDLQRIQGLENRIAGLEQLFGNEFNKVNQSMKKNNEIVTSRFRKVNVDIGRVQSLVNYFENYLEDELNTIRDSLPDAPKPARKRTVALPKPMRPNVDDRNDAKDNKAGKRPQRPGKTQRPAEPILDFDEPEEPEDLMDEIDEFNN